MIYICTLSNQISTDINITNVKEGDIVSIKLSPIEDTYHVYKENHIYSINKNHLDSHFKLHIQQDIDIALKLIKLVVPAKNWDGKLDIGQIARIWKDGVYRFATEKNLNGGLCDCCGDIDDSYYYADIVEILERV
jgi:hypothetical protein